MYPDKPLHHLCSLTAMQNETDKEASSAIRRAIGARIAAAREAKGLTQPEAIRRFGWDSAVSRLSNYEKGVREPDAATMIEIAKGLETTPAALMFGDQDEVSRDLPGLADQGQLPKHVAKALQAVISAYRGNVNPAIFDAFWLLLSELTAEKGGTMAAQNEETSPLTSSESQMIERSRGKTGEHLRGQHGEHAAKRRQSR